jgi:hypothetical protein
VLHPIEGCAGERCRVETVQGIDNGGNLSAFLGPHQPFRNVRAITHSAATGCLVEVRFDGEVFETEDQRNWTDASFKTYGTPLAKPFPVWIERGTSHRTIGFGAARSDSIARVGSMRSVESGPIPELHLRVKMLVRSRVSGFGVASHGLALHAREAALLRQLRPAHLRVICVSTIPRGAGAGGQPLRMSWLSGGIACAVFLSDAAP